MVSKRLAMEVSCIVCGRSFRPWSIESKYCSQICFGRSRFIGDKASYFTQHQRVYAKHGKAKTWPCSNHECPRQAEDWANLGDYDGVDDYIPLCKTCHTHFDLMRRNGTKWINPPLAYVTRQQDPKC